MGVKGTTTAYRPFCGYIVSLKFREHFPICNGNTPWTWSSAYLGEVGFFVSSLAQGKRIT